MKSLASNMATTAWICPDPRKPSQSEIERAEAVYEDIRRLQLRFRRPERLAGFELEIALYLLRSDQYFGGDNLYWQDKCRALLMRPAMEPIGHLEKPVHFAWILLLCRLTA